MTGERPSDRIVVVLWETQDLVNIAGTVRAMKNFGLTRLRLVTPAEWDAYRIEGIAHDTEDVVARATIHETLTDALADCAHVVALSARGRRAKRAMARPREIAPDLLERASALIAAGDPSSIALLFGREDQGLSNAALDLAHRTVSIPTNPDHKSLNLAQAVLVMAYELWLADERSQQEFKAPRRDSIPAPVELLEKMFEDLERALWTIDFFKTRQTEGVMRTLRGILHRAELDTRESSFLRAVAIEVRKYFERMKQGKQ